MFLCKQSGGYLAAQNPFSLILIQNQAQIFTLLDVPNDASVGGVALSDTIMSSFEPDDRRRSEWIGTISGDGTDYYFPFKYKVYMSADLTEYSTVFRLAEQYLIRPRLGLSGITWMVQSLILMPFGSVRDWGAQQLGRRSRSYRP